MTDVKDDLINRRVLKNRITYKAIPIKFEEETRGNWQDALGMILGDIYKVIDDAPTVDAVVNTIEVRPQGEWVFKNGKYRCTSCGEKAIYCFNGSLSITQTELLTHFCPNCGAKMFKNKRAVNG